VMVRYFHRSYHPLGTTDGERLARLSEMRHGDAFGPVAGVRHDPSTAEGFGRGRCLTPRLEQAPDVRPDAVFP
jgi:hypothetical protein